MRVVQSPDELGQLSAASRAAGGKVGLVPTMGALHQGHVSLLRHARAENRLVVMSNFVNPLQFGPGEDYVAYPRDPEGDARLAASAGVDVVFQPDPQEMYPPGYATHVEVTGLDRHLCGKYRPGHFRGVATVVLKLFNLVQPDRAYFGLKDYQQVAVITRMVQDLNVPVEVVACATVRETDGLAMSSRNRYLSPQGRAAAPVLYRALHVGKQVIDQGERSAVRVRELMLGQVGQEPLARVQYLSVSDASTLQELEAVEGKVVLALAVWIEGVRLIDNLVFDARCPSSADGEQTRPV
ncbi:MAG TPA: pantoate--beta-alanine ligase [Clostridiales bacterium UBA8153]|nr:pantoate--beta-alanine ligase [Clostridiales bacterium UBA8153]